MDFNAADGSFVSMFAKGQTVPGHVPSIASQLGTVEAGGPGSGRHKGFGISQKPLALSPILKDKVAKAQMLSDKHLTKAGDYDEKMGSAKSTAAADKYTDKSYHHNNASEAYDRAAYHYKRNNEVAGNAAMSEGKQHGKLAAQVK